MSAQTETMGRNLDDWSPINIQMIASLVNADPKNPGFRITLREACGDMPADSTFGELVRAYLTHLLKAFTPEVAHV